MSYFSSISWPFIGNHPTFPEYSSCPSFAGDDRPSWVFNHRIVDKRRASYSPQRFGAWRNCREFVRSCPLSLSDEYLVGMYFWSILVFSRHMLRTGCITRNLLVPFIWGDSSQGEGWGDSWVDTFHYSTQLIGIWPL